MKNGNLTRSIDSLLLGVGTALTLGIMVSMEFRHNVGVVMDAILGWLPEILPFHIVLFALAAITGLYASLIQKYTMDWDYLKRQQETMRSFQKEFRAAQLAGDKARQQQLRSSRGRCSAIRAR